MSMWNICPGRRLLDELALLECEPVSCNTSEVDAKGEGCKSDACSKSACCVIALFVRLTYVQVAHLNNGGFFSFGTPSVMLCRQSIAFSPGCPILACMSSYIAVFVRR